MRFRNRISLLGLLFATLLAALAGIFPWASSAAARLTITGTGTDQCAQTSQIAASALQGELVSFRVEQFLPGPFDVWLTLPDGRNLSPELVPGTTNFLVLPLLGLPPGPNPLFSGATDAAGTAAFDLFVGGDWPSGCYTLTLVNPFMLQRVSAPLVVLPNLPTLNPGPAQISVVDDFLQQPSGPQGTAVTVFGSGFQGVSVVLLSLIQPDNSILELGAFPTTNNGSSAMGYAFPVGHQLGLYRFIATGLDTTGTDGPTTVFVAEASFELTALVLEPVGDATLRVSAPYPGLVAQGQVFQLIGTGFTPFLPPGAILLEAVLPDGAIIALPAPPFGTDANGDFAVNVSLDNHLPVGLYTLVATDFVEQAVTVAHLTFTAP